MGQFWKDFAVVVCVTNMALNMLSLFTLGYVSCTPILVFTDPSAVHMQSWTISPDLDLGRWIQVGYSLPTL